MTQNHTNHNLSFLAGVVTGGAIAAGLALYFRPQLRKQLTRSLNDLRENAAARTQTAVNDVAARGEDVLNEVASAVEYGAHAVSQGAREVERFARASKTVHQKHT